MQLVLYFFFNGLFYKLWLFNIFWVFFKLCFTRFSHCSHVSLAGQWNFCFTYLSQKRTSMGAFLGILQVMFHTFQPLFTRFTCRTMKFLFHIPLSKKDFYANSLDNFSFLKRCVIFVKCKVRLRFAFRRNVKINSGFSPLCLFKSFTWLFFHFRAINNIFSLIFSFNFPSLKTLYVSAQVSKSFSGSKCTTVHRSCRVTCQEADILGRKGDFWPPRPSF